MPENPETIVTRRIRKFLVTKGAYFIKISDQYTRGIPDSLIVTDRNWMVEFKRDSSKGTLHTRTYKSLTLSGAQDSRIRNIYRRSRSSCVISDLTDGGRLRLWVPLQPEREGPGFEDYTMICEGEYSVARFMGLK